MIRACVRSKIVKSVSLLKPESFQIFYLRISNNPHIGKYHLSTWWLKLLYKTCWPNLYVFKQVCFLTCYRTPMPHSTALSLSLSCLNILSILFHFWKLNNICPGLFTHFCFRSHISILSTQKMAMRDRWPERQKESTFCECLCSSVTRKKLPNV